MADAQTQPARQTDGPGASTRDWRVLRRALATGIAALWLTLLSSLLLSAAQAAGRAVGVPLPQLLHTAFAWARQQSLYNQIGLAILGGSISVCVIWFTVWAWGARAAAQLEAEQQAIDTEKRRFWRWIAPLVKQGKRIEAGVQKVSAQIDAAVATKYTFAPVRELDGVSGFNLGRPSAATFPYYEKPFTSALALARGTLRAIQDSGVTTPDTLGIVVVGKADAGKTRLALKTLGETLPDWTALVWSTIYLSPSDVPPYTLYAGSDLVLFVDDLQDYAPGDQALAGAGTLLRTLLASLRRTQSEAGRRLAVVATCRLENLTTVRASLGWLVGELELVQLPEFSPDPNNPVSAGFIADLERLSQGGGRVFPGDWNGRIGSLVLGVEVTRELYARLVEARSPAISVLCAMKLLARAGVPEHTTRRIRGICANIYGEGAIRKELRVWRQALDDLVSCEFVRRQHAAASDDEVVVILRENDFDEVVTCYQDGDAGLAHDRDELLGLFSQLGDAEALLYLGNTYFGEAAYTQALAAYDEALVALNQAATLDLMLAAAWYNKGVALAKLNRYDEALVAYEQATTRDPTFALGWCNKGNALANLKRYDEALVAYEQATTRDPTLAPAWYNTGVVLDDLKRYDEALVAYEQATTRDPTNAKAWANQGTALAALQRYEEALVAYEQATTRDPMLAAAWYNTGVALDALSRYEEALVAYEQATTRDPTDAATWYNTGVALAELKRYEEAVTAYGEALAREPDNPVTLRNKADVLYEHLGRHAEALEAIQQATALDSDSIRGWAILGDVERALGHTNEAEVAYERALTLEATDDFDWFSRGRALAGLGRHEEALVAYAQALAEDADDRNVLQAQVRSLRALGRDGEAEAVEAHSEALGG